MTINLPLAPVIISSEPTLKHTPDEKQKTVRCFGRETIFRCRTALALKYSPSQITTPYTIVWEGSDCKETVLALPEAVDYGKRLSALWKTFVQIHKDHEKVPYHNFELHQEAYTEKRGCWHLSYPGHLS